MRATVPASQRISQYPVRERVTVTKALSLLIGKSEAWCHARLYRHPKLAELTVAAIKAYRHAGDIRGLEGFTALLRDALNDSTTPALTNDLELAAAQADVTEDLREKAFDQNPCPETARARVLAIDTDIALARQVRDAIVEKYLA